jgi:uncharacterized membrane protein YfhO
VVADSWFPGWSATVDGRPAVIHPTNGFLRGIAIDGAGPHEVDMVFDPPGLRIGLAGTALGFGLVLAVALRRSKAAV